MLASLKKKETYEHYLETLKFALYCITHPLDGFWDLTHEKRGTIAAANTILLLTLLANLFKLSMPSFPHTREQEEKRYSLYGSADFPPANIPD